MTAPDYEELTEALSAAAVELSAAEVHGLVTAAASLPQPPPLGQLLLGEPAAAAPAPADESLIAAAQALQDDVRRRLERTDFEFEPLLGQADLAGHVRRLGEWARGYVFGLAAGGLRDPGQLGGEAGEFVLDAMRIGEAEMDEDADVEQQQRELAEIVEYLRVGVQLVYEELRGGESPAG